MTPKKPYPNVLIVDDSSANLLLISEYLDDLDEINIITLNNGSEAINLCYEKEMAVILLDLMMPDIDGFGVLEKIREKGLNMETPVVILSGAYKDDEAISMESIEKGAIDFMPKPLNYDLLRAKTNQLIKIFLQRKELSRLVEKLEYYNVKIRDSQVLLKKITSAANDAIIVLKEDCKIKFWNESAQKLFGYHKYEVMETSFKQLLVDDHSNNKFYESLQSYMVLSNELPNIEGNKLATLLKRNGLNFPAEVSIASFHNQKKINLVLIIRDITERIKIQNNLIKNKELKEANKIMRDFMDNVSHEIRTPMNAIIGISKMIHKYKSDNLTPKQKEGLEMITSSGNRLLDLINDILDLSRIDAGKVKPSPESFSFDKLIASIKSTVIGLIHEKDIKTIIRKSNNIPEFIIGDYRKLTQILINILGNSVKFTDRGKIELSTHINNNMLHFEITDTGIGMTKEECKIIFDRFRRIESPATKKYKGTGLGLAITKELVEILNGRIEIQSEPGKGTIISFSIPVELDNERIVDDEKKPENTSGTNYKKSNKKKIMIIDDDEDLCYLLDSYLKNNNFDTFIYNDGLAGYKAIAKILPDLIVLDLETPLLTGYDIMKRLHKIYPDKFPVLVLTGTNSIPYKKKYTYSGLLLKPVTEDLFIKEIGKIIKKD